jgi:integrase
MSCIVKSRRGRLVYRLFWDGIRSQEGTGLRDTPVNRQRLQRKASVMSDEIVEGRFDYLRWFPKGNKAQIYGLERPSPSAGRIAEYVKATWLPRKQPPLVRTATARTYSKHWGKHILPAFGGRRFAEVTLRALEDFRALLTKPEDEDGKGLKLKTARDIIDGTFRAIYRDARREGLATGDPFADLAWPRKVTPEADPFDADERDLLCAYFRDKDRAWLPLVFTRFWTGLRPSEVRGLRRGDWDARSGRLTVRCSRTFGEDNAPKTEKSRRTITLPPEVNQVLRDKRARSAAPLAVRPDDFLFTTPHGNPVDEDRFVAQHWHKALRATGVRPRKFHATRHTFMSIAVGTPGISLKWLADYCGTSVAMIEKHYSRWMHGDAGQLALLAAKPADARRAAVGGDFGPQT